MANLPYYEQKDRENTEGLREPIESLPPFCSTFFRDIEPLTLSRAGIIYTCDLKVFFDFLMKEGSELDKLAIQDITISRLDQLRVPGLEEYMGCLKYRFDERNQKVINKERGIMREIAPLKDLYNYFYRSEMLKNSPAALVQLPKLHEKEITRLDIDEVALLLDKMEQGDSLARQQKAFHEGTKLQDLTVLTLLLGTEARVPEYVGSNIFDVGFKDDGIHIRRKSSKEVAVYFDIEVEEALLDYLGKRKYLIPESDHEDALFLSLQIKRISVHSVENLVKRYAKIATPLREITPHRLRSTYDTSLYRETSDIYLAVDVLGHTDVSTTKKYCAALEDERRRSVRNAMKLREQ